MQSELEIIKEELKKDVRQCYGGLTAIRSQLDCILGEAEDARLNTEIIRSNIATIFDSIKIIKDELEELKNAKK